MGKLVLAKMRNRSGKFIMKIVFSSHKDRSKGVGWWWVLRGVGKLKYFVINRRYPHFCIALMSEGFVRG